MKLSLEIFSHRSGEAHLNSKPGFRQEIESVLLQPRIDITTLSRTQFIALMRAAIMARGWEPPPSIVDADGVPIPLMEFIKNRVGVQFAFQPSAILPDIMRFQSAYDSRSAQIDVGVYVVGTTAFQSYMRRYTGKVWGSITFMEVVNYMPIIGPMVKVPLCLMGLDVIDYEVSTKYRNINMMGTDEVKDIIIQFLKKKYGCDIERDVRVTGMGRGMDVEFDAVMRLADVDLDVIFELEVSTEGILHSRILADDTRNLTQTIEEYHRLTGRNAELQFLFFGRFPGHYIDELMRQKTGQDMSDGALEGVRYEVYPLEDLGLMDN